MLDETPPVEMVPRVDKITQIVPIYNKDGNRGTLGLGESGTIYSANPENTTWEACILPPIFINYFDNPLQL